MCFPHTAVMAMELGRLVSGGLAAMSAALLTNIFVPPPAPTLTASPSAVQPGGSVTISGSGFGRCLEQESHPAVDLFANNNLLASATGTNGAFQQQITVPGSTAAGPFLVTTQCSSDPDLDRYSVSVAVVTLALSPGSGVPGTTISATGSGYTQCPEVKVQLVRGTQAVAVSSPADAPGGTFDAELPVPASAIPGDDYQVEAGCYPATSATTVAASEPFTVTPLATSPSPTPVSPSPTTSSPSPSPSPSTAPSSPSVSSSASSSTSVPPPPPPPPLHPAGGHSTPAALIGGTSAGAVLIALAVVRASSLVHRRRGRAWVSKHMRAVAGQNGSVPADVQERPGAASISVGIQPHPDPIGHQQDQEAGQ